MRAQICETCKGRQTIAICDANDYEIALKSCPGCDGVGGVADPAFFAADLQIERELVSMLRRVLALVDRKAYSTHAQQETIRDAEALASLRKGEDDARTVLVLINGKRGA